VQPGGLIQRHGRLARLAGVAAEERLLAGRACGMLWAIGGVTAASFLRLPGIDHSHRDRVIALVAGALSWGLVQALAVPWRRVPGWLLHVSALAGFAVVAVLVASTGASRSPGWIYLFFVAVFAAYFFPAPAALAYLAGCVLVQAAPLVYDRHWSSTDFVAELVAAAAAYFAFGATVLVGKAHMRRHRAQAELLAAEQAALRRVATAAIQGEAAEAIYDLVASEAARLLRAGAAGVLRFDGDRATVMGSWADEEEWRYKPGATIPVDPGSDLARARALGAPVRIAGHLLGSPIARVGYSASIIAPVLIDDHAWGALAVAAANPSGLGVGDERKLTEFGALLASVISSLDERATLADQAATDPLTGLANRRALGERLAAELSRAQRHRRPLSVAIVDIDHFKQVNDYGGHEAGDAALVELARCLSGHARAEDAVGRLGGDELAWIMPDTTREQALVAIERFRRLVAAGGCGRRITISAGICDTTTAAHPAELLSCADSALYWSKAHGRNRCWIYDPEAIGQLSGLHEPQPARRLHSLHALHALARTIDAKQPGMSEHSERVAELAVRLAHIAGWSPDRAMLLREAALLHDLGKIGVPADVLAKPGPLSRAELAQVREHAELTARIVEGVLEREQVAWIRAHHERPDGDGYPDGLGAREIPDGAALLSLADAWDAMTSRRPYGAAKPIDLALRECAALAGRQFSPAAVSALLELHANDELEPLHGPAARVP
jgi:diguanylate cyclase (GGDEF)-like protein